MAGRRGDPLGDCFSAKSADRNDAGAYNDTYRRAESYLNLTVLDNLVEM